MRHFLIAFLTGLIKTYQLLVSPLSMPTCRFYPSCSHYCIRAIERFGPFKGSWLALLRILKCNPWGPNGYDPVPPLSTNGDILTGNTFNTDSLLNSSLPQTPQNSTKP
ncbi:MAG: membrane protein insertion efficiency factor YidD [Cyanobacteria bacterium P01_F01_bin.153]